MNNNNKDYLRIPEFYAGKSVFITGGSGFLGKVLIEKLIYNCPLIEKVYVLIREKKNISAEQRLKNIFDQPAFSRLQAERPEDLKKIIPVKGDLEEPNLSISPEQLQTIRNKVSIIIHAAATVKFNESLKVAIAVNLEGTKNVLQLCKTLTNKDAFVYVSTAYSNADRKTIEEVVYPPPTSLEEAYKILERNRSQSDDILYLNGWPNTYTYTKALAENLVTDTYGDIPAAIVRPSIVTGAASDPVPGWVDNWYGPTGLITPIAIGVCRTLYTEYDYTIDIIPVDYVCNLILVAAARAERSQEVAVYNSCSGSLNPISVGRAMQLYTDTAIAEGLNILPFPHLVMYTTRRWLMKMVFSVMYFVTYAADVMMMVGRKKPRLGKIHSQSVMVQDTVAFFSGKNWLMKSDKALALANSLSITDYDQFPCNPQTLTWEQYVPVYFRGVKKYLIEKR